MTKNNIIVKKWLLVVGLLLIGVTFILNERVISQLFSVRLAGVATELKVWISVIDLIFVFIVAFAIFWQSSKSKILIDISIGLGFTLLLLAGIEGLFYYLNCQESLEDIEFNLIELQEGGQEGGGSIQPLVQPDDWLGYKHVPHTQIAASRKKSGELLYNVIYSTDEYGRRITPGGNIDPASPFILFFGGSFTFGDGVNDDETMPYYVSQTAPEYRVYNYGVTGYGPQQMLAKLQNEEITAEIEGNKEPAILVYTFIRQHIGRAIGSMWIHNQRGDKMPYYYLDPEGTLIRKGDFVSGRPALASIYAITGKSQTLKYFGVSFPLKVGDRDFQTTARIIEESRNLFREKFNSDQFYVLIYPTHGISDLLPYLEAANIAYFDYSDLPEAQRDDFWLDEGHPAPTGHQIVARKLVQGLALDH